jgi:hypothetical protein
MGIFGAFVFLIFVNSLDFENSANIQENSQNITELIAEEAIPEEVTWIQKANEIIKNPYLLLFTLVTILWLFGYFLPKHSFSLWSFSLQL